MENRAATELCSLSSFTFLLLLGSQGRGDPHALSTTHVKLSHTCYLICNLDNIAKRAGRYYYAHFTDKKTESQIVLQLTQGIADNKHQVRTRKHLLFLVITLFLGLKWASLVAQLVKNPPALWETWVRSLGWEDPLEKGKATHSSILAWRILWTV